MIFIILGEKIYMPKSLTQYDLLVSCPGDIKEELTIIGEVVERFNEDYADVLNMSIRIRHWHKSGYAQSGGKPQALLNEQFIKNCDAAIAIFWTRFGTPTDDYGSGTEEEIALMTEAGKQVFVYFSEVPVSLGNDNSQYERIKEFKTRYSESGLYYTYEAYETFRRIFTAHLAKYFMSIEAVREVQPARKSQLRLMSINASECLEDMAHVTLFKPDIPINDLDEMLDVIRRLYDKINNYPPMPKNVPIDPTTAESSPLLQSVANWMSPLHEDVTVKDDARNCILAFAKARDIAISEVFFELGGLSRVRTLGLSQGSLIGSAQEREKYGDILKLGERITEAINWKNFEDSFRSLNAIKLCVENIGTTYDEDIDVVLRIPMKMLVFPEDIPFSPTFDIEQTDYSFYDIFGITKTSKYLDFDSSIKHMRPTNTMSSEFSGISRIFDGKSEKEEYYETLGEIFDYDFFCKGEYSIVKLHIDYIKHHTAVAFPTVLFVTEDISNVEYEITSKHCDSPINGILAVAMPSERIERLCFNKIKEQDNDSKKLMH
jgi:hypothetical protein